MLWLAFFHIFWKFDYSHAEVNINIQFLHFIRKKNSLQEYQDSVLHVIIACHCRIFICSLIAPYYFMYLLILCDKIGSLKVRLFEELLLSQCNKLRMWHSKSISFDARRAFFIRRGVVGCCCCIQMYMYNVYIEFFGNFGLFCSVE